MKKVTAAGWVGFRVCKRMWGESGCGAALCLEPGDLFKYKYDDGHDIETKVALICCECGVLNTLGGLSPVECGVPESVLNTVPLSTPEKEKTKWKEAKKRPPPPPPPAPRLMSWGPQSRECAVCKGVVVSEEEGVVVVGNVYRGLGVGSLVGASFGDREKVGVRDLAVTAFHNECLLRFISKPETSTLPDPILRLRHRLASLYEYFGDEDFADSLRVARPAEVSPVLLLRAGVHYRERDRVTASDPRVAFNDGMGNLLMCLRVYYGAEATCPPLPQRIDLLVRMGKVKELFDKHWKTPSTKPFHFNWLTNPIARLQDAENCGTWKE